MYCESFMVITKQKPITNMWIIKRKESKHTTTKNYQCTKNETRSKTIKEPQSKSKNEDNVFTYQ